MLTYTRSVKIALLEVLNLSVNKSQNMSLKRNSISFLKNAKANGKFS